MRFVEEAFVAEKLDDVALAAVKSFRVDDPVTKRVVEVACAKNALAPVMRPFVLKLPFALVVALPPTANVFATYRAFEVVALEVVALTNEREVPVSVVITEFNADKNGV